MREVVITSVGACTPIGLNYEEIRESLLQGKSGISLSQDKSLDNFPTRHAGYIELSKLKLSPENNSRLSLFLQYTASQVFSYANIDKTFYTPERQGCILGAEPPMLDLYSQLPNFNKEIKNFEVEKLLLDCGLNPNRLLLGLARKYSLYGPSYLHLGTCSASAQAIGEAAKMIKSNRADLMLCGGISSRVDPMSMLRLIRIGALARTSGTPNTLSRPFDKTRTGFTMGEGAIFFILETIENAQKRGIKPLAKISGYGAALDGNSITDPHPESLGMILSMQKAIQDASLSINQIDYINAHGTSTTKNDKHETQAIKKLFQNRAYDIPISSTKSMHGHLMSAAGAIEALAAVIAINESFIPPTINYNVYDEECDLNYTPNKSQNKNITHVLSNSFGLGGQNASLVISKV